MPPGNFARAQPPIPLGNFYLFTPPHPLGISIDHPWGGMDIFWNHTFATCNGQSSSVLKVLKTINPLTPSAFYQKHTFWTFWRFSACIWAKLAPIYSKRHWQRDILLFPPVSQFMTFLLRHVQKSKFRDFWTRKWPTALGFSFCYFFFCLSFFSPFLIFLL